jgi:hypothetical protein
MKLTAARVKLSCVTGDLRHGPGHEAGGKILGYLAATEVEPLERAQVAWLAVLPMMSLRLMRGRRAAAVQDRWVPTPLPRG